MTAPKKGRNFSMRNKKKLEKKNQGKNLKKEHLEKKIKTHENYFVKINKRK